MGMKTPNEIGREISIDSAVVGPAMKSDMFIYTYCKQLLLQTACNGISDIK